jgi:C1A family cysteine protease
MPKKLPYRLGWRRPPVDRRDLFYHPGGPPRSARLPERLDRRDLCPWPALNQGALGSCTMAAGADLIRSARLRQGLAALMPSRLFGYYNTRLLEGSADQDAGAHVRNVFKAVNRWGYCREELWPYKPKRFAEAPRPEAYADASTRRPLSYRRVEQDELALKQCLADGHLVEFGFTTYPAFFGKEVARGAPVPMPRRGQSSFGGHAVLAVGFDSEKTHGGVKGFYLCRNSFGRHWGERGYFWLPFAYVHDPDLADDFWTVTRVAVDAAAPAA